MTKIKLLRFMHKEMLNEYVSISYLADATGYTRNRIWCIIRDFRLLGYLDVKYSEVKSNVCIFKFKQTVPKDFNTFLAEYEEKL